MMREISMGEMYQRDRLRRLLSHRKGLIDCLTLENISYTPVSGIEKKEKSQRKSVFSLKSLGESPKVARLVRGKWTVHWGRRETQRVN